MLTATPVYAALLVPLYLLLAVRVILYRRRNRIAYGDSDYPPFQAMVRAHGNFAEYAPLTLLLMALAEINGTSTLWLHLAGLFLLFGRTMHGLGMAFRPKQFVWRVWGMWLTFAAISLSAVLSLLSVF